MLLTLYILLAAIGLVATYLTIRPDERAYTSAAEEVIWSTIAIFAFTLVSLASGNVEVPSHGETIVYGSTALFWFWIALAFVNVVYFLIVPIDRLARAQGISIGDVIGGR